MDNLIETEFSVDKNIAKKRIKELKKIFVEFDKWAKVDVVKEMVYSYINNQLISSIALGGIMVEIIFEEKLNFLEDGYGVKEPKEIFFDYHIFKHLRKKLRFSGQKLNFFKDLNLDKSSTKMIRNFEKIISIRNKYIHIQFLKAINYREQLEKDSKDLFKNSVKNTNKPKT